MRLAAGLRPDPLGELKRSPRPLAAKGGLLLRGGGGRRWEGGGGKGEGEGRGGILPGQSKYGCYGPAAITSYRTPQVTQLDYRDKIIVVLPLSLILS